MFPFLSLEASLYNAYTLAKRQQQHTFFLSPFSIVQSALEMQVRDLTTRLEEGVATATKNAKREAAKLQARVHKSTQ